VTRLALRSFRPAIVRLPWSRAKFPRWLGSRLAGRGVLSMRWRPRVYFLAPCGDEPFEKSSASERRT